jgi:hypothetical protein
MMSQVVGGVVRGLLPGFETDVRCVVKDVGEFRLVELVDGRRVVEYSKEVQEAFDQAFYRVSDARDGITKPQDRVRLTRALFHLFLEAREDGASAGGFGFAPKIAETLGRMIVEAMQANDVESAITSCASSFKAALRGVATANSVLPHKRRSWLRPEAEAIIEGHTIFLETGERPTKSAIRAIMEKHLTVFRGRNAASKWREVFFRANLHELPE